MNVLFLGLSRFDSYEESEIYPDLLREFIKNGHNVYSCMPIERRDNGKTHLIDEGEGKKILKVKTLNLQKTSLFEKGLAFLTITGRFKRAISKFFKGVKFDLILYPTPPITLCGVVEYIKKRDNAKTYLMLKDIFPQNSLDLGILKKSGLKGFIYRYFKKKEKKLYSVSDKIGCMSQANVDYLLQNDPEVPADKVEICPNSIEVKDVCCSADERFELREKYGLPNDKTIFVYGGNLGRPQDVPFIIECIKQAKDVEDAFFFVVGSGTDYSLLERFINEEHPVNVAVKKWLPKEEFDKMLSACDAGLIFLDYRFTIPNFPSRLLSYAQAKLPIICATDQVTDVGDVVEKNGFGWKCFSNDTEKFCEIIKKACSTDLKNMGETALKFLKENYSAEGTYKIIENAVSGEKR